MNSLQKALLQTTSPGGAALTPQDLNPVLMEYLGRLSPLYRLVAKKQAQGRVHEFVVRTSVPPAWFEGEVTTPSPTASGYERRAVQLKILRNSGGVSGFQQATSQRFVDALQTEIVGSLEGIADTLEWATIYGDSVDAYQFDGLEAFLRKNGVTAQPVANGGNILDVNAVVSLSDLDAMVDVAHATRAADRDAKVFIMSQQMISKISGLQTRINRTVETVETEGGFRFVTYRDIPILPSSIVRPTAVTSSPAVSVTATAGGTLANGTYHYRVASVTDAGEQVAGTSGSVTISAPNSTATLTWTADPDARLYKIFRGATSAHDNMALVDVIPARTYNAEGAVTGNVTTYADNGSKTPLVAFRPYAANDETIALVNISETRGLYYIGMVSPLGEPTDTFLTYIPLATRKSAFEYMIEAFTAVVVPYPQLHVIARRARVA